MMVPLLVGWTELNLRSSEVETWIVMLSPHHQQYPKPAEDRFPRSRLKDLTEICQLYRPDTFSLT